MTNAYVSASNDPDALSDSKIELTPLPDGTNIQFVTTNPNAAQVIHEPGFDDKLIAALSDVDGLNSLLGIISTHTQNTLQYTLLHFV